MLRDVLKHTSIYAVEDIYKRNFIATYAGRVNTLRREYDGLILIYQEEFDPEISPMDERERCATLRVRTHSHYGILLYLERGQKASRIVADIHMEKSKGETFDMRVVYSPNPRKETAALSEIKVFTNDEFFSFLNDYLLKFFIVA